MKGNEIYVIKLDDLNWKKNKVKKQAREQKIKIRVRK